MTADADKHQQYMIKEEPYYRSQGSEVELFESAYHNKIPVLLKGPTGCGKTRFMQYMAWKLKRPLITVPCHDDLTASDLVGRYLYSRRRNGLDRWSAYDGGEGGRVLLS